MITAPSFATESNALLSVVIPVYNSAKYLRECLHSVCNQTYQNLEIICVNDGSSDNSAEILEEYAAKDPRIVVLNQENNGQGGARNNALQHAHGEYVIGLDSDDFLEPRCYEIALQYMTDDVDMVVFDTEVFNAPKNIEASFVKYFHISSTEIVENDDKSVQRLTDVVWNKIMRLSLIKRYQITYPEKVWYEDMAFVYKYVSVTKRSYYVAQKLYHYRVHESSVMGRTNNKVEKVFDVLKSAEDTYAFLRHHNLWSTQAHLIERLGRKSYYRLNSVPTYMRLRARLKFRTFVRKWGLHDLFPHNTIFDSSNNNSTDIIDQYILECVENSTHPLNVSSDQRRKEVGAQDIQHYQHFSINYYLFNFIPLLTIRSTFYQDKKISKKRYKLFNFIPILLQQSTSLKQCWLLFHFIPVWKVKTIVPDQRG